MKLTHLIGISCISATLILTACATTKPDASKYSGWMKDYSRLTEAKTPEGDIAMRWIDPKLVKGEYTAVIIDRPVYYPAPKVGGQVPENILQEMPTYISQQLGEKMPAVMPVVQKPGPGVLHMKMAITGVETPTESLQFYEVVPVALVWAGISTATGMRDHVTLVYLETEVTDSQTGEVVAQSVRKGIGKPLEDAKAQLDMEHAQPILNGWVEDAVAAFNTFIK